jgi:hypothetical protein
VTYAACKGGADEIRTNAAAARQAREMRRETGNCITEMRTDATVVIEWVVLKSSGGVPIVLSNAQNAKQKELRRVVGQPDFVFEQTHWLYHAVVIRTRLSSSGMVDYSSWNDPDTMEAMHSAGGAGCPACRVRQLARLGRIDRRIGIFHIFRCMAKA